MAWVIVAPVLGQAQPATTEPASAPSTRPATPTTESRPVDIITMETAQSRFHQFQQAAGLDAKVIEQATAAYTQAIDLLKQSQQWADKAAAFEKDKQAAPALLESTRAALQRPATVELKVPEGATLAQCEAALAAAQTAVASARRTATDLDAEHKARPDRRKELPGISDTLRAASAELRKQENIAPPAGEAAEVTQAKLTLLQARQQLVRKQMSANRREGDAIDATNELLTARQDLAASRLAAAQKAVKFWQDVVRDRRRSQAEQAASQAQTQAADPLASLEAIEPLVKENIRLTRERVGEDGLAALLERIAAELSRVSAEYSKVRTQHKNAEDRANAGINSSGIGQLLLKQRGGLPNVQEHRDRLAWTQEEYARVQSTLKDLEDQRAELSDIDECVRQTMSRVPPAKGRDMAAVEEFVRAALLAQRSNLDALANDYTNYASTLVDLESRHKRLLEETAAFAGFIDERILWVRSTCPLGLNEWGRSQEAARFVAAPATWRQAAASLSMKQAIWLLAMLVAGLFVSYLAGRRAEAMAASLDHQRALDLGRSVQVVVLAMVRALWLPGVVWYLAAAMGRSPAPEAAAVSAGLIVLAQLLLLGCVLVELCRRNGLGEIFFHWPAASLSAVRRRLPMLMAIVLPLAFVAAALAAAGEARNASLGRACFTAALIVQAVFTHMLLRPHGQLMSGLWTNLAGRWPQRLRLWTYVLGMAAPLALGALAAAGYYYTAGEFVRRLVTSLYLVAGLLLLQGVLKRWRQAARRRMAMQDGGMGGGMGVSPSIRDHDTPVSAKIHIKGATPMSADARAHADKKGDLVSLDAQAKQLFAYLIAGLLVLGLWLIWKDVSSALSIFKRVELWSHVVSVDSATGLMEKTVPVTLVDLALALVVAVVTWVAARNLPGLIEMTVMTPLRWTVGGRYAFSAIFRYVVGVAGCIVFFSLLGLSWPSIQWLVAAMTVGLGFGLQEIFANFVSGLIVLLERPVRVGDVVTVAGVTGTVSRIRIRATTITDFDRKELIVPNKEFITSQLVNWTLSDTILRVIVPVGITYNSDTDKAKAILLQVARDNSKVMHEPAPDVHFAKFGESSLEMQLKVFVRDMESFLRIPHELNMAICEAFRAAGIEMAFPTRDVNLKTIHPLPVYIEPKPQTEP